MIPYLALFSIYFYGLTVQVLRTRKVDHNAALKKNATGLNSNFHLPDGS